jgi:hypothetical protein
VLPSEFLCPVLADPNLRFCRSLASRSTPANQSTRLTSEQTIDLKALDNPLHPRFSELRNLAQDANARHCRIMSRKNAPISRLKLGKSGMTRKDAQLLS